MGAFLYGIYLQWKLDIRSKTLLITCYIVPLLFFAIMGGIFTSVMPEARYTLIQSMTVFGVTMGALIGLPPSLVEIYSKMCIRDRVPGHQRFALGFRPAGKIYIVKCFPHALRILAVVQRMLVGEWSLLHQFVGTGAVESHPVIFPGFGFIRGVGDQLVRLGQEQVALLQICLLYTSEP